MGKKVTPVRKQYLDIKRRYPDSILFFRLGDFYETFDEDAKIAARELDIVLTSRNVAKGDRIPMAGIPYHAAENYLARLIEKGYHVAICEQVGEGPVKGLFPREVVRVVTPGTVVEPGLLPGDANNYLAAIVVEGYTVGVAYADVTTGEFFAGQFDSKDPAAIVRQELIRINPAEVLVHEALELENGWEGHITTLHEWQFDTDRLGEILLKHFGTTSLEGFGLGKKPLAVQAAGLIVEYLGRTEKAALTLLTDLSTYSLDEFMALDAATRRNLELTETILTGSVKGSLLGVLDETVTPMGRRLLRQWITKPLLDLDRIERRLDQVEALFSDGIVRAELTAALEPIGDIERLTNRITAGLAQPRDLSNMRELLTHLPRICEVLEQSDDEPLQGLLSRIDLCEDIAIKLQRALAEDPPATLSNIGVIRKGYSKTLDRVLDSTESARTWIDNLEQVERDRTGIRSLKVGYNKVFGYYIEVTKANTEHVPDEYIRKQTLVNAERYITPELKDVEAQVLSAEDQIHELEVELFQQLCREIGAEAERLLRTARALARLDVVASLADVASRRGYRRPVVLAEEILDIRDGRHPVVEAFLEGRRFVPNDAVLEEGERVRVLTGPNMSGKSTYLRQVALISLMAQMGSFVPAESARLGLTDRIFTRIGAQDEIHTGQSTFMVEMLETANILHHATSRSLLILDEVGRGTSTYDGVAIAWAVVEFIHNHPRLRARTLFATHYHELTRLAEVLPGVRNYNVAVSEEAGQVVFLHRITPGGADKSYGIHVAELAGLPRPVINRAQEILAQLEADSQAGREIDDTGRQMALFPETNPLLEALGEVDVDSITPLEAINRLYEWQKRFLDDVEED